MRRVAEIIAVIAVVVAVPSIAWTSVETTCHMSTSGVECADTTWSLPRHAVYTSGATLMGLTAFGSVVGARIIVGKNESTEYAGAILMVGGAFGVILMQGLAMLHACCDYMNETMLCVLTFVTVACSLLIVVGFGYIVFGQLRSHFKNQDQGQPPARDGKQEGGQSGAQHSGSNTDRGMGDKP